VDWDKIRIFYTVAEAGSFTRAGDDLGLSQSAVSRQISALERELKAPLFHRHARGLILTEQGDLLFRAARDMRMRLETTKARLVETSERPSGELKVTTTVGLGSIWLAQRIAEFLDLYPDVRVELILSNEELDLAMREADVAIRLRRPAQPDLIQRRLFTVQDGVYGRWLLNTFMYAVVSAGGAAVLAALGGYGFAKFRFPGNRLLFGLVLGAVMVPSTALAIPTYLLFSKVGLVDTPWAIILPSLVNPFGLYLMRVYAEQAVPDGMIEAARIDGAGEFRIFWKVAMRLLAPGFVTVLLFTLVATWNNYFLPLIMLNDPSLFPVTVGLANWAATSRAAGGASGDLLPLVITGSLLSIIPLGAAFLMLQRFWQSGLGAGGVKQ